MLAHLYLIYHLASHDSWLHLVFMETVPQLRELLKKDEVLKQFTQVSYLGYDLYELNYLRMQREIIDIACGANEDFVKEIYQSYLAIFRLTASWHPVARDYIRFMTEERMHRMMLFFPHGQPQRMYMGGFGKSPSERQLLYSVDRDAKYLEYIIHGRPDAEALVHDNAMKFTEVPYSVLTGRTLGLYENVNKL